MPELPEVEIARENLERWIGRRRILEGRVLDARMLRGQKIRLVEGTLRGAQVREVSRRGKYLIWDLGKRGKVATHFGMSGKFVLRDATEPIPPSVRVLMQLARGRKLAFVDPRRLGSFQLVDETVENKLGRLGVEPLETEFTSKRLTKLLTDARLPIKSFLMDQHRIAGLGNIHTAEALFRAGIHPARVAGELRADEIRALHRAIRATLTVTVRKERSDEMRYLQEENARNEFLIYGRSGEPCPRCQRGVHRIVQSGRSTYFCPRCQPTR
jgi:formamidopyrimidine-DNA glycosylase